MKTAMAVLAVVLSLLLLPRSAGAEPVYKCEEEGVITYTDRPCSPGAEPAELPDLIVTPPPTRSEQDLARAQQERLARERAERDRDDAQWLKEHAAGQDRADPAGRERKSRERRK
jgi:hypothetical protein